MDNNQLLFSSEYIHIMVVEEPDEVVNVLCDIGIREISESSLRKLHAIFNMISCPLTVVCENNYLDAIYQDSFHAYYSKKYSRFDRFCKRLSFFAGVLDPSAFLRGREMEEYLQERFIGVSIIRPIRLGEIGQTILSPYKLHFSESYVQTANFTFSILGHTLTAEGFTYSSQDAEIMTCAETTAWNILEFYAEKYTKYQGIKLSRLLSEIDNISFERALPSYGLTFEQLCRLLKCFGVAPRMYSEKIMGKEFHRLFHCYVDSGFPLLLGLSGRRGNDDVRHHAVVCMGFSAHPCSLEHIFSLPIQKIGMYPCINSADLYDEYVIMDDNRPPYTIIPFQQPLSADFSFSQIEHFIVPLHENLYLDPLDVSTMATSIFQNSTIGFSDFLREIDEPVNLDNPLIMRTFLTSSDNYSKRP